MDDEAIGASIILVIWLFVVGCWIGNVVKLVKQDFEPPYKSEVIHAVGLIGPASVVTVWFD